MHITRLCEGTKNFEDPLTVGGFKFHTFKEAGERTSLLEDDKSSR